MRSVHKKAHSHASSKTSLALVLTGMFGVAAVGVGFMMAGTMMF